jgi:hypothetical protein
MAGNVPNISNDTFVPTKDYSKVEMQQGVPVLDSDLNELQDLLRHHSMKVNQRSIGNARLPAGSNDASPGYEVVGTGASNDFTISGGYACVEGIITQSKKGVSTPSDIQYDSQDNLLLEGTVSSVGSGNIVDEDAKYENWHSLVGCRVVMTSGIDIGVTRVITSRVDSTTLALSGGTGSIAASDSFYILPPALTTPASPRTDEVYIMAFHDDINSNEDTALLNPSLGMEPSHRSKLRSCVRVSEGGSTPITPDKNGFGVRYMRIAVLSRTNTSLIQPSMVRVDDNGVSPASLKGSTSTDNSYSLIWRNQNWPDDSDITNTTVSVYTWSSVLAILTGGYISSDGHIHTGATSSAPVLVMSDGSIRNYQSASAATDIGSWLSAPLSSLFYWHESLGSFQGANLNVSGGVTIDGSEGNNLDFSDGGHIVSESSVASIGKTMFEVASGLKPSILYTQDSIWIMHNCSYDTSDESFVSISASSNSTLVRFKAGLIEVLYHGYSLTKWYNSEWSVQSTISTSKVATSDLYLNKASDSYSYGQEKSITYNVGLILLMIVHPIQGRRIALYSVEEQAILCDLISGTAAYFDNTNGHAGTVNLIIDGGALKIQNNLVGPLDIRYHWIQIEDMLTP